MSNRKVYCFNEFYIREGMMDAIRRYVEHGIPPGDFLEAVFANNLTEAIGRADGENQQNIVAYAQYMYAHVPMEIRGSREKVDGWIRQKAAEAALTTNMAIADDLRSGNDLLGDLASALENLPGLMANYKRDKLDEPDGLYGRPFHEWGKILRVAQVLIVDPPDGGDRLAGV
ncbi:MAG: hypothetical protein KAW17_09555 [Candidatus Eisenbacteria sp.]|nr:hypothetical protein [Candidatus Eisenbacteria bacterium]